MSTIDIWKARLPAVMASSASFELRTRFGALRTLALASLAIVAAGSFSIAEDKPAEVQTVKLRVLGLFSPDRVEDLKATVEKLPEVKLLGVDYATAEATFEFDAAQAFPGAKPEQIIERFDNRMRTVSRSTFGIRALCTIPREELMSVEIPVAGLDCKACELAAYESINRIDGVEQATASFKDGLVTAWIDPDKTDREKLEAALKQRGVTLKQP